jgi:hypothetical protein
MRRKTAVGGTPSRTLIMATRWAGGLACVVGLVAWSRWLHWRITGPSLDALSIAVLVLELCALAASGVIAAALWSAPRPARKRPDSSVLPDVFADLCRLEEFRTLEAHGSDDSGEVARARRGLRLLDPRRRATPRATSSSGALAQTAWAVISIEGIRRMIFALILVLVLLTGRSPFGAPPWPVLAALVAAQVLFAVGHWLLSGGVLRPGARLRWSMASVGAGLGDGASRTGLPIRWTATMATMVVLNLAIALRGLSDRWTHGLGPMPRDERVAAMVVSWWLVLVGFAALRVLVQPSLGFYGATRRLEETSTRRLALGTTLAVAMVGFVAGVLPGGLPA